jgi:hypothetical protein
MGCLLDVVIIQIMTKDEATTIVRESMPAKGKRRQSPVCHGVDVGD